MMKILSYGSSYVGLVSAACLADEGHQVQCLLEESDSAERVLNAELKVFEPGLKELIEKNISSGHLQIFKDSGETRYSADVFMMCPSCEGLNGKADVDNASSVIEGLCSRVDNVELFVGRSSLPPGSVALLGEQFNLERSEKADIASFPEFMSEGNAILQYREMEFCILGASSEKGKHLLIDMLGSALPKSTHFTTPEGAELIKYGMNSFFAIKMSFTNELARISDHLKVEFQEVYEGLKMNRRISPFFLQPGIGYGGKALPKNVESLAELSKSTVSDSSLFDASNKVNQSQSQYLLKRLKDECQSSLKGKTISICGLSYKSDSLDISNSPSIWLIDFLLGEGSLVKVYDPEVHTSVREVYGNKLMYADGFKDLMNGANALFLMNPVGNMSILNWKSLEKLMKDNYLIDGRNFLDKERMLSIGFSYIGVGR